MKIYSLHLNVMQNIEYLDITEDVFFVKKEKKTNEVLEIRSLFTQLICLYLKYVLKINSA